MDRPLYADATADVAFDDAIELLATDPARLLQAATDVAGGGDGLLRTDLHTRVAGFELARAVEVEVGAARAVEVLRSVLPLRWRAERGHALFPTVDAQLEVAALAFHPPRVQVTLSGSYHPPFGSAGALVDGSVLRSLAETVVERFVCEVAARLELAAREAPLSSAAGADAGS